MVWTDAITISPDRTKPRIGTTNCRGSSADVADSTNIADVTQARQWIQADMPITSSSKEREAAELAETLDSFV